MSDAADERIVTEAKKRFDRCVAYEGTARALFQADMRFVEGDSDNNYQWEASARAQRLQSQRPCLTINKTKQHCLQIINDARQNKAQIRINAVGDHASYEAAQIYEGIVRHIEYQSNATEAYESAEWSAVSGGIGYFRVTTDYVSDSGFDQEIFIRRIRDTLSIYLDPDIQEFDGSDARFAFAFRDVPRDEFERDYPDLDKEMGGAPLGKGDNWDDGEHVRIAEYFRKVETSETMVHLPEGGDPVRKETLEKHTPDVWAKYKDDPKTRLREKASTKVEWFKIVGSVIVERNVWPGKYIPIVRVIGEETVIDGVMDRKGHVRALKDPQRMYNWHSSNFIEEAAMQSKSPWLAPSAAIEGLETYWNATNIEVRAFLPWNHVDDDGKPIPPPTRMPPKTVSNATLEGLRNSQQEMMMVSGQYQAQFGENENAKSGVAIQTRQRQGDNATYHFIDHLAQSIRFAGKILIDLIPKIYDTPRVIKIMAEDGEQSEVHIDPNAPNAHQMVAPAQAMGQQTPSGHLPITPDQAKQMSGDPDLADKIKTIFNPKVGRYDVEADVGPAYATRRQETANALLQITTQNQEVARFASDLLFKAMDFPLSDEIAERLKRTVPPEILGVGPPPQLVALQQQATQMQQHMQGIIATLTQQLAEEKMKAKDRDGDLQRKDYEAETARMAAVGSIDPEAFRPVIRELISQALATPIVPIMAAHADADQSRLPAPSPAADAAAPAP